MNSRKTIKLISVTIIILFIASLIVYTNYNDRYNEEQYKLAFSEAQNALNEGSINSAKSALDRAEKFSNKHSDDILKLTGKINDMQFDEDMDYIKKTLISKEKYTASQWDIIDKFISENKNNDKVKVDLSKFVLEKWKEYANSIEKSENVHEKLSSVLSMLRNEYPENQEINLVYNQYITNKVDKELAQPKQEIQVSKNLISSDENLELINHSSSDGYIKGSIKNNSSNTYGYVEVNINLYDKNGNQVGNTLANVTNLEAYKTWNFEAVVIEKNVSSYKIINIKASN